MLRQAAVAVPSEMQGQSLLPLMKASSAQSATTEDRPSYAETDYPHRAFGWSSLRALRTGKYLYVRAPQVELYNQASDPQEKNNLAPSSKAVADTLGSQLEDFRRKTSQTLVELAKPDPEQAEKLRALGYVASDTSNSKTGSADSGIDPKSKIEVSNLLHDAMGIKTFALWRLGSEDRSLWKIWDVPGEATASDKIKDVPPGQDVDMEGQGEILRIETKPADGQRNIKVDPATSLITDETFSPLPTPYRVGRYGYSPKQVAITFDDGPDPEWTPKILDILKDEHVPATFFLIGIQADKFGDVTKRVYREGHEIGNHTFTHPDIANISRGFMKLELNLTEELFGSRLGVRTILFRPPYSIDQEPDTADQVRPLETTQDMGYITIGDKVDPNDWRDNPRRSAEQTGLCTGRHARKRPIAGR